MATGHWPALEEKMKRKLILLLLIVTNFFVFSQTRDEFEIFDFFEPLNFDYTIGTREYYISKDCRPYDDKCNIKINIQKAGNIITNKKINAHQKYIFIGDKNNWISTDYCVLNGSDKLPEDYLFFNNKLSQNKYWIPKFYTEFSGKKYTDIINYIETKIPKLKGFYPDWNGDEVSYWTNDFSCSCPFNISFTNSTIVIEGVSYYYFMIQKINYENGIFIISVLPEKNLSIDMLESEYIDLKNIFYLHDSHIYEIAVKFENNKILMLDKNFNVVLELISVSNEWINTFTEFLQEWDEQKVFYSTLSIKKGDFLNVNENLKLRSGEATSTQVLAVMSAGTKVKILELGKAETIDGKKSNWVKVEIISGKDRDGNKLKSGMAGWCYGGYLK